MQQAAFFAGGQHGDGVGGAGSAEVGAFERVNGNIHGRILVVLIVDRGAHFFADKKHGRFIAFAFADDDRAVHGNMVHDLTHRFGGGLIGLMAVAGAHGACGGDGRLLDHAQQFQTELNLRLLHLCSRLPRGRGSMWPRLGVPNHSARRFALNSRSGQRA